MYLKLLVGMLCDTIKRRMLREEVNDGAKQEIHATVSINNVQYEVIKNFRDGFSEEAFKERYAEILNKYDYIVGDWGYEQLRLRGFFDDSNQRATYDTKISTLSEYLYEYCNFGCAHFVLRKVKK